MPRELLITLSVGIAIVVITLAALWLFDVPRGDAVTERTDCVCRCPTDQ